MALTAGTRLGPYEVTGTVGAGGMGEVYRALDTNLGRQVAIKILPDTFAHDPERLARFEREAKTLASLNHPNIAQIYGLERSDGVRALVMELVEGPTLANRIAQGAIPVDEALPIARQIADGLEAAHEQGIVHRDLKPANIKVRPDGTVKVLDFGLAKALEPISVGDTDATASPTITSPALMTGVGVLLGTAAYMSPEQARCKTVDKRTDIWAFGCVLFEMLTGRRAFDGADATDVIAAVIRGEPDWAALQDGTPPRLRSLLKHCLEKDPKQRLRDIGDARFELEEVLRSPTSDKGVSAPAVRVPLWRRAAMIAAVAVGAATGSAVSVWLAIRPDSPRTWRTTITPSGSAALALDANDRAVAIAPDGSRIAYIENNGRQLLVRPVDELEPTPLTSGSSALVREPFFSADSQWVGYFEALTILKKVPASGGPSVTLSMLDGSSRGATWAGADGTIIVATLNRATGLQRVPADGGAPTVLTRPDAAKGERDHFWPQFLPGGRAVLFTIVPNGPIDTAEVAVLDLETGAQKIVVRGGSDARYLSSGHLVYGAAGTLRAIAFDLERLETRGAAVPVVAQVVTTASDGAANFGVADDGTLTYALGRLHNATRTLVWVNRQGVEAPVPVPARAYTQPRLSPDGTRVALVIGEDQADIWVWDLARETLTRATFDAANDTNPVWSRDGRQLLFASARAGTLTPYVQAADATGSPQRLTETLTAMQDAQSVTSDAQVPTGLSPDGARLVVEEFGALGRTDLFLLNLADRRLQPLVQTPFDERNGEISPDGRWLAHQSNESGQYEIYIRPFPDVESRRWQISSGGGIQPLWSRNGEELFYVAPAGSLMSVRLGPGSSFIAGPPMKLFDKPYLIDLQGFNNRDYDVSPDGRRFLMRKDIGEFDGPTSAPSLVLVQNWLEELTRLVPVK